LIQRFGSVEAALDRASEVEKKTYRESLLNNRDVVLLSKQLVTIDTNVAVEFDPEPMKAQDPDFAAAKALFTELEFTTLVTQFLEEGVELGETEYREAQAAAQIDAVVKAALGGVLAIAVEASDGVPVTAEQDESLEDDTQGQLALSAAKEPPDERLAARAVAISAESGKAAWSQLESAAGGAVRKTLEDGKLKKSIHDLKTAMHSLAAHGVELAGVRDDTMLYGSDLFVAPVTRGCAAQAEHQVERNGCRSGGCDWKAGAGVGSRSR
jgi:DNA polymerase-1